jgi:hypothetical protein
MLSGHPEVGAGARGIGAARTEDKVREAAKRMEVNIMLGSEMSDMAFVV